MLERNIKNKETENANSNKIASDEVNVKVQRIDDEIAKYLRTKFTTYEKNHKTLWHTKQIIREAAAKSRQSCPTL